MLRLTDVSVHYGRVAAVQSLTLEVNQGELVGLVGHNGAGKSTTLWVIAGVLKPTSGAIAFEGQPINGMSPEQILRRGISLVPENRRIFTRLTVGENLKIGTSARRDRRAAHADITKMCERFEALGRFFDLVRLEALGRRAAAARDRASPARATPAPASGRADARSRAAHRRPRLRDPPGAEGGGVTILLVEQNAARTIEVSDRTYVLRSGGRVALHGTSEELAKMGDFETAYIGMATEASA